MQPNVHKAIYCRSRSPGALLIRAADGFGQWSHCAGILADGVTVIESRAFRGVVATPLGEMIDRSSDWFIVERVVEDKARGDRWALSTVGEGYDYLGAAGVPWGRDWQAPGAWFCSEHNEQWQERAGLFRFVRDTRGVGPNVSYRVK